MHKSYERGKGGLDYVMARIERSQTMNTEEKNATFIKGLDEIQGFF